MNEYMKKYIATRAMTGSPIVTILPCNASIERENTIFKYNLIHFYEQGKTCDFLFNLANNKLHSIV